MTKISIPDQTDLLTSALALCRTLTHPADGQLTSTLTVASGSAATALSDTARTELDALLTMPDPRPALKALFASPLGAILLPEVAALDMDQGGRHLHKDNLQHSITVCAQAPPRLRLRWGCLLHDVGKTATRQITDTKVMFHGHESVGATLARKLLYRLGYATDFADQVARLVEISGRTHDFDQTWTDSALRRYITDSDELLADALDLSRADCTSARPGRREQVLAQVDAVSARIAEVLQADTRQAVRPALDGEEIMQLLALAPGREVGRAYRYLLSIAQAGEQLSKSEASARLISWWEER